MQPMTASGEMRHTANRLNGTCLGGAGLDFSASDIGTIDSASAMAMSEKIAGPCMPTTGMTYCASVTEPRSTKRYTESVRARLEFVTCALIQLSMVANRQATAMPMRKRIANQKNGSVTRTMVMDAADAMADMAAKTRIWPIFRNRRVTLIQPTAKPRL